MAKVLKEFSCTEKVETFTATYSGDYLLEVWGAQGGNAGTGKGGKGGYSKGVVTLKQGDVLYICVGGQGSSPKFNGVVGTNNAIAGGYNGGGAGCTSGDYDNRAGAGGGGCTHIAKATGTLLDLRDNKTAVLIVAGGGGGAYTHAGTANDGGYGGGLEGGRGKHPSGDQYAGEPGTQESGYFFGRGASGEVRADSFTGGTGSGAGYYGGNSAHYASGSGGSGYVKGLTDGETKGNVWTGNGKAVISAMKDFTAYIGSVEIDAIYLGDTDITYRIGA